MEPITRAIIVLDQTSGALRADDEIVGLDLTASARSAVSDAQSAGTQVILAVPGLATTGFAGFGAALPGVPAGVEVVPIGPLAHAADSGVFRDAGFAGAASTALVSADRRLRGEARAAGLVPAAHPALLSMLARGEEPRAARVAGPRAALDRLAATGGVVPMQYQPVPGGTGEWALFGLFTDDVLVEAALRKLSVVPLAYDPGTQDLVWIRPEPGDETTRAALSARGVLYAEPDQVLVALDPGEDAQALGVHGAHGHTELLSPDPGLLRPPDRGDPGIDLDLDRVSAPPAIFEPLPHDPLREMRSSIRPRCATVTAHYAADLDRYSGVEPLDGAHTITSRHVAHPDNGRATDQLVADLEAMGYCTLRHDFVHAGATHSNVIADLPGAGRFRIRPDLERRLLEMLREPRIPIAAADLPVEFADLLAAGDAGDAGDRGDRLRELDDHELRAELERAIGLRPWYPWWRSQCRLPGWGAGLVVVGAHLDSTAGFEPGYRPSIDPAPGRDDNGSGLAAVLSLARYFRRFAGRLTHTIRFCFFNAEEVGLVGSKAYASHLKAMGAPVREVICTDMMGYNADSNRIFEVHAGFTDPAVRDLGLPIADSVAQAAAGYGVLAPAQVYKGTGYAGAPDRDISDGAINRSDHAAFQQQGWGAVLVSEDFFANLAAEPAADPNPGYHRAADRTTDLAFSRDIVCAVARAVLRAAA